MNTDLLETDANRSEEIHSIDSQLSRSYSMRSFDLLGATQLAETALRASAEVDYPHGIARSESHLALYHMISGRFDEARTLCSRALERFQELDDLDGQAGVLYSLGSTYYKSDDPHLGVKYMLQCRELLERTGNQAELARCLKTLGGIFEFLGEYELAEETNGQCLRICHEIGDRQTESNVTSNLSSIYLKKGDVEQAWDFAKRSIEVKEDIRDIRGLAFAYYAKAKVLLKVGRLDEAEALLHETLRIHRAQGEGTGEIMALIKLGKVFRGIGNTVRAREAFEMAAEKSHLASNTLLGTKAHHNLYEIAREDNRLVDALHHLEHRSRLQETLHRSAMSARANYLRLESRMNLMEQEARIQQEKSHEIEAKNAELDTLIYRISHDIRGPIASMLGLSELVKHEVEDPTAKVYFDLYSRQVDALNTIVMDLTNLSRVRSSHVQADRIPLRKMIMDILAGLQYMPHYTAFAITIEVDESLELISDRSFVNSILQNLLENGLKYGFSQTPRLQISAQMDDTANQVTLRVEDSGVGIEPEKLGHIFDLFYRATADTTIHGTGMGLYIARNAATKLGGTIRVKSEPGKGTCFEVEMPSLPDPSEPAGD